MEGSILHRWDALNQLIHLVVYADIYVDDITVLQFPVHNRFEESSMHITTTAGADKIFSLNSKKRSYDQLD